MFEDTFTREVALVETSGRDIKGVTRDTKAWINKELGIDYEVTYCDDNRTATLIIFEITTEEDAELNKWLDSKNYQE